MLQNELISRYAGELFELLAPVKVTGSLKINLISWLNGLAGATDSSRPESISFSLWKRIQDEKLSLLLGLCPWECVPLFTPRLQARCALLPSENPVNDLWDAKICSHWFPFHKSGIVLLFYSEVKNSQKFAIYRNMLSSLVNWGHGKKMMFQIKSVIVGT